MLVHSFIYYQLNDSIISDETFDRWAKELVELQETYPTESELAPFYEAFKGFDGSSGFDLPFNTEEIRSKAYRLLVRRDIG